MTVTAAYGDRFCEVSREVTLCYQVDGEPAGTPLVLLAGLGLDLTSWSSPFVEGLVARGFRVVRPDNRDAGRSTHLSNQRFSSTWRQVARRPGPSGYALEDMAADTRTLLDRLEVDQAHLVGMSMGGMIAQVMAAAWPDRTASLTSIFSTTGAPGVGQISTAAMLRVGRPAPRSLAAFQDRHMDMMRLIGSTDFPFDEGEERAWAGRAWQRGGGRVRFAGTARQIDAIARSGDRTASLARITAPTLVIHGDEDLMVHPSGGRATTAAVPGARLVTVDGMRHHLAPGLTDRLTTLISDHAMTAADSEGPLR